MSAVLSDEQVKELVAQVVAGIAQAGNNNGNNGNGSYCPFCGSDLTDEISKKEGNPMNITKDEADAARLREIVGNCNMFGAAVDRVKRAFGVTDGKAIQMIARDGGSSGAKLYNQWCAAGRPKTL
jgi:hypothetical protein